MSDHEPADADARTIRRRRGTRRPAAGGDDRPVLPDVTRDEQDVGWGDESGRRDLDWYDRERPPHHE